MTPRTAIVIKWGDAFRADEVNRLAASLRRNVTGSLRFLCLTDCATGLGPGVESIPLVPEPFHDSMLRAQSQSRKRNGALRKISLFRSGLVPDLQGPLLALDLDVLVTGPMDALWDHAPGQIVMAPPFSKRRAVPHWGEGSVIRFDPVRHGFLYDVIARDPEAAVAFCRGSEQSYTSGLARAKGQLAHFPKEWVLSFKRDCRPMRPFNFWVPPSLPPGARVVCFHGRPKLDEALTGYRGSLLRRTRPAAWIADHIAPPADPHAGPDRVGAGKDWITKLPEMQVPE